jgi:AraC-like DNA-binding protein
VVSIWGRPTEADAAFLTQAIAGELTPGSPTHASFVDLRALRTIDPAPFEHFVEFMASKREALARVITRSALVHGRGVAASTAAGYVRLIGEPFESAIFEDGLAALRWVGYGTDAESILSELTERRRDAADTPSLVARLRVELAATHRDATLASTSRRLGVSTRSLQRSLLHAGTSYHAERQRARIDAARRRLVERDETLEVVAWEVGYRKLQTFNEAFEEVTGERPRAWRDRHRGAP